MHIYLKRLHTLKQQKYVFNKAKTSAMLGMQVPAPPKHVLVRSYKIFVFKKYI